MKQQRLYSLLDPAGSERRQRHDRRQCNNVWASFRFSGRRQGARRYGEGENTYVDRPARHVIILTCTIVFCSIFDALLTLLYIERGGGEANPVMAVAIDFGTTAFVGLKMALTIVGIALLAVHQNFRLGLRGLYGMTIIYLVLLTYHGIIWLGELY
jgi:Domain of unknown function (DUF5658)